MEHVFALTREHLQQFEQQFEQTAKKDKQGKTAKKVISEEVEQKWQQVNVERPRDVGCQRWQPLEHAIFSGTQEM